MHVAGTNMLKFTKIDQKTIKITYLILKYINACTIRITLYFNGPSTNWTSVERLATLRRKRQSVR